MELVIPADNPSILRMVDFDDPHETIAVSLSYKDKAANFAYQRFKKNSFLINRMGPEKYAQHLLALKDEINKSLLKKDDKGYYTYSGLAPYLSAKLRIPVKNEVVYPEPKKLAWDSPPPFTPYEYQTESKEKLLAVRHGGVELGTGLGKSLIIAMLCREIGLKTIIMTPSTSISDQLYENFSKWFGMKLVGRFFGNKKESKKLIVIANAAALTRVEPGTPHWEALSDSKVFIADESHQCPANTFEAVCSGVAAKAPYRFFFSATQLRQDGRDLLLEGIIGKIVYTKTVREGVDEGYLSKPVFRIVKTKSDSLFRSDDANAMTRTHLYYNDQVVAKIGAICNSSVNAGHPVLVLIEEVEQFTKLLPYLRHNVGFAHGPLTTNKDRVPKEYWDSDPNELVSDFNSGRIPILVGTSCISTGTDIRAVKTLIFWKGGKSEIDVKQSVGRATRKVPGKTFCSVIDFDVSLGEEEKTVLERHVKARMKIYEELYPNLRYVE